MSECTVAVPASRYELCFSGLSTRRCEYAFPCDKAGLVDIDELTGRRRTDYFYARTMVGKELSAPVVAPVPTDRHDNETSVEGRSVFSQQDQRELAS